MVLRVCKSPRLPTLIGILISMLVIELENLEAYKEKLIEYMYVKILAQDWHAVADAANDLREIDAKLEVYDSFGLK